MYETIVFIKRKYKLKQGFYKYALLKTNQWLQITLFFFRQ